jgi:hypothetical protein
MNAKITTRHHGVSMTITEIVDTAVKCGASASFPHLRDVAVNGKTGAVRKTIAAMGMGLDSPRRGVVQSVYDAAGRCWGNVNYTEDGRCCAVLAYLINDK